MKRPSRIHGWLILNKPKGMSSNAVLSKIRRHFGSLKVGYAGTLDPLAEGVLPIAFGEATKLMDYMVDTGKSYTFRVAWGRQTTTDDEEGEVIKECAVRPSCSDIEGALSHFLGTIDQRPPIFSALKIKGKRACDRVREGEKVVLESRKVFIESLALKRHISSHEAEFHVVCGKGTYVRSLARDLGEALGTCGYVRHLQRDSVGAFHLEKAMPLEKLLELEGVGALQRSLNPMDYVLDDIPAVVLEEEACRRFCQGQAVALEKKHPSPLRVKNPQGNLVALANWMDGWLRPRRVFVYEKGK